MQWHSSMTCEENARRLAASGTDDSIGISFDTDLIKCCPMCGVPIEKDEGCAQMMCKRCKHVFCWYCLASLDVSKLIIVRFNRIKTILNRIDNIFIPGQFFFVLFFHSRMISCCVITIKGLAKINWVIRVPQWCGIERKSLEYSLVLDYCCWLRRHYYCSPHRALFAANAEYAAAARNLKMPTRILTMPIDE